MMFPRCNHDAQYIRKGLHKPCSEILLCQQGLRAHGEANFVSGKPPQMSFSIGR